MRSPKLLIVCPNPNEIGQSIGALRRMVLDEGAMQLLRGKPGTWIWTLRTYLELKSRGTSVEISAYPSSESINFSHVSVWRGLFRSGLIMPSSLPRIVSCTADKRPLNVPCIQISQTPGRIGHMFVPHWPELGLVKRDQERRSISTAAFFGPVQEAEIPLHDRIRQRMQDTGVTYVLMDPERWNDYSGVDVAVGLRPYWQCLGRTKPASKLYNSVIANVPFIGTPEPAYLHFGRNKRFFRPVMNVSELTLAMLEFQKKRVYEQAVRDTYDYDETYFSHSTYSSILNAVKYADKYSRNTYQALRHRLWYGLDSRQRTTLKRKMDIEYLQQLME